MTDHAAWEPIPSPDVSHLVTEDDTPVDNLFQEKQCRLLVEPLYSSWRPVTESGVARTFLAASDVAVYSSPQVPAIVPDVLLSMDVEAPDEFWKKDRRSYYVWEFGGKPPEVAIEIVSNREGGELEAKRAKYSLARFAHYVVFDHMLELGDERLYVFQLQGDLLIPFPKAIFPRLGLGLTRWRGRFETKEADWLRWCYPDGALVPTGEERAEREQQRAEREQQRAERLAARLRALGVDPDDV